MSGLGAELEQPLGLRRARCWVWRAAGCPWARAVPTHPGCSIRSCAPIPNPPRTARVPRPRGASPVDPAWSKVPPCTALSRLSLRGAVGLVQTPSSSSAPAFSRSAKIAIAKKPSNRKNAASQQAWQLHTSSPGCPSAIIWSSDIRAGTQAHSLPVQRPQNSRASCQVCVVFSLQREPWELPDDKAVTHPRARQSRRNCRDTQDLWSSLHPA